MYDLYQILGLGISTNTEMLNVRDWAKRESDEGDGVDEAQRGKRGGNRRK